VICEAKSMGILRLRQPVNSDGLFCKLIALYPHLYPHENARPGYRRTSRALPATVTTVASCARLAVFGTADQSTNRPCAFHGSAAGLHFGGRDPATPPIVYSRDIATGTDSPKGFDDEPDTFRSP
jgi:hypothetical protein